LILIQGELVEQMTTHLALRDELHIQQVDIELENIRLFSMDPYLKLDGYDIFMSATTRGKPIPSTLEIEKCAFFDFEELPDGIWQSNLIAIEKLF